MGIAFAADLAASIENYTLVCFVCHYDLDNQGQRDGRFTVVKAYTTEELLNDSKIAAPNHQLTAETSTTDQYALSSTIVKRSLTFDDPAPRGNSKHADNVEAPSLSLAKPAKASASKKYRN